MFKVLVENWYFPERFYYNREWNDYNLRKKNRSYFVDLGVILKIYHIWNQENNFIFAQINIFTIFFLNPHTKLHNPYNFWFWTYFPQKLQTKKVEKFILL